MDYDDTGERQFFLIYYTTHQSLRAAALLFALTETIRPKKQQNRYIDEKHLKYVYKNKNARIYIYIS